MCTVMASAWLSEASYGAMLGLVAALGLAAAVCGTLMVRASAHPRPGAMFLIHAHLLSYALHSCICACG